MRRRLRSAAVLLGVFCAGGVAQAQGGYSVVGGSNSSAAPQGITPASSSVAPVTQTIRPRGERGESAAVAIERRPWDYAGVAPGAANVAPGLHRFLLRHARRGGVPIVAWPGFQMTPGGSRVFLAVTGPVQVTTEQQPGRLIYRLHNARVVLHNNERPLETEAFDTPVERAWLRPRGRDVDLVIVLRNQAVPQMSQQPGADGIQFVYVDFAAWRPPSHIPLGAPGNPRRSLTDDDGSRMPPPQSGIRPSVEPEDEVPPAVQPGQ